MWTFHLQKEIVILLQVVLFKLHVVFFHPHGDIYHYVSNMTSYLRNDLKNRWDEKRQNIMNIKQLPRHLGLCEFLFFEFSLTRFFVSSLFRTEIYGIHRHARKKLSFSCFHDVIIQNWQEELGVAHEVRGGEADEACRACEACERRCLGISHEADEGRCHVVKRRCLGPTWGQRTMPRRPPAVRTRPTPELSNYLLSWLYRKWQQEPPRRHLSTSSKVKQIIFYRICFTFHPSNSGPWVQNTDRRRSGTPKVKILILSIKRTKILTNSRRVSVLQIQAKEELSENVAENFKSTFWQRGL